MERYQSRYGGPTTRTGKHSESGRANTDEKVSEMSAKIKLGLGRVNAEVDIVPE